MKRIVITLLTALMFAGTAYGYLSHKQLDQARALTVLVENTGFLGGGRGTGILLDSTHVLTCAHMIRQPHDEFFVYTYPLGHVYTATVEMADQQDDVAILVLAAPVLVPVKAKFVDAEVGDEVTVVGNALGASQWVVTRGVVSSSERGFLLTDAVINPGNSGGPWVNNKGEIVAMTDWTIGPDSARHTRGICGGIDAKTIRGILNAYSNMKKLQEMLLK